MLLPLTTAHDRAEASVTAVILSSVFLRAVLSCATPVVLVDCPAISALMALMLVVSCANAVARAVTVSITA